MAHARRRRRTGRDHVAGGHADARVGCYMAGGGVGIWRAHGLVGPGKILGAVTRKRYTAPQFKLDFLHLFFRVGLCPTRFLNVQVTRRLHVRWMISWGVDHVDLSPRDRNHSTCVICTSSDHDRSAKRSPRGTIRSVRSSFFQMQRDRDQTATI